MAIKNPFNFSDKYENPNRNTFDVSYQNNVTFNLGEIIPIQCKEVLPNTTVSFDTTLGLSFMPLIFPVQTRMRAEVKSFYVRNRTLWKEWQDFIGKTKDNLIPPYLAKNDKIKTGSLSDYLGLSTTLYGNKIQRVYQKAITSQIQNIRQDDNFFTYNLGDNGTSCPYLLDDRFSTLFSLISNESSTSENVIKLASSLLSDIRNSYLNKQDSFDFVAPELNSKAVNRPDFDFTPNDGPISILSNEFKVSKSKFSSSIPVAFYFDGLYIDESNNSIPLLSSYPQGFVPFGDYMGYLYVRYNDGSVECLPATYNSSSDFIVDSLSSNIVLNKDNILDAVLFAYQLSEAILEQQTNGDWYFTNNSTRVTPKFFDLGIDTSIPIESTDVLSPYYDVDNNPDGETITCLAHRAYESIYNYWYRDSRNNPRIVNGQPEYNKFVTTDEGGIDRTDYHIFHDNWEQDFLTTAVQSPQQGIAPLVGITSYGEFQFRDEDGNVYSAQATFDSDGDTITGFGVLSPDMPQGNKRQLVNLATYGISISDLRNVNALQRWLEINMRRGLRYQDQIKSHFGVDTKFKDYMYPEFIGGHNEEIYIKEVDQTVPTNETPLGWKAGQATSFGQSRNRVTHFCDEHGFIITCIVVKPVANYSQLVPKHFYKKDTLDYFFPEFGHLSMQSIPYREVAPIQAVNEFGLSKLGDTFGYQRAWYEYFNVTDEIHGLFRTNLRNFVVQRQFTSLPELGNDFLTVNHEELDDIFAVSSDDVNHKIIGQIYFDYKIKLPIPKYGIPRLEA